MLKRLRSSLKRLSTRRREALKMAAFLHRSSAWHCGCAACRGDSRPWLLIGETLHLTEAERERLRGSVITLNVK